MTPAQYRSLAKAHERFAAIYANEAAVLDNAKKSRPRVYKTVKRAVKKKAVKRGIRLKK